MTGFHQNYIGAHQHRTKNKKPLPYGIKPIPHLLEEAGYFTATMAGAISYLQTALIWGTMFGGGRNRNGGMIAIAAAVTAVLGPDYDAGGVYIFHDAAAPRHHGNP